MCAPAVRTHSASGVPGGTEAGFAEPGAETRNRGGAQRLLDRRQRRSVLVDGSLGRGEQLDCSRLLAHGQREVREARQAASEVALIAQVVVQLDGFGKARMRSAMPPRTTPTRWPG
jgi:hypothetical protein